VPPEGRLNDVRVLDVVGVHPVVPVVQLVAARAHEADVVEADDLLGEPLRCHPGILTKVARSPTPWRRAGRIERWRWCGAGRGYERGRVSQGLSHLVR
jgi:hypothetical protein